jgi:hypothetical protein
LEAEGLAASTILQIYRIPSRALEEAVQCGGYLAPTVTPAKRAHVTPAKRAHVTPAK